MHGHGTVHMLLHKKLVRHRTSTFVTPNSDHAMHNDNANEIGLSSQLGLHKRMMVCSVKCLHLAEGIACPTRHCSLRGMQE